MSKLRLLIFISLAFASQAQHLTISNTGETGTSGTNWSISGNVLQVSGSNVSANVHPSVIVNHLTNTGDLAINIPNINGVFRNIIINNAIAYTGNTNRTLVIKAQNHITMNTGGNITSTNAALNVILRSANASGIYVEGYLHMTGVTINTNGGHLWIAGGGVDTQWNGLTVGDHAARIYADAIAALKIYGCTLNTNGGQLYAFAHTFESGSQFGDNNYGLDIDNTTISTGAGNIDLKGELFGRYTTGFGTFIGCRTGNIQISTTSGYINISGLGYDQNAATNGNGARHATNIAVNSGRTLNISTVSGNITISGSANFNNSTINDAEGLLISSGNTAKSVNITSQTGNITLTGSNTRATTGQFCNGIRLYALDVANAIYIGDDGINPYTGNITIQADAILQRVNNAGAGSIALKTSGALTIQPVGNNFTYLRAGNSPGTLTFDDDWNFGSSNSVINLGKSGNSFALTLSNAISTNGLLNVYAGSLGLSAAMTNTGFLAKSTGSITVSNNITSNAGNITLWADADNNGAGGIMINDNVTIDSRTAADRTANTHTTGGGKITLAGGLDDGGTNAGTATLINGLVANDNLPDGYAVNSGSAAVQTGIVIGTSTSALGHNANVNMYSGGGDIRLFGKTTANNNSNGPTGLLYFEGHNFNGGTNGNISMIGNATLTSGDWGLGIDFAAWRTNSYSANSTIQTVNGNIQIIGRAANGTSGNVGLCIDGMGNNRHIFVTTGSGNITFNGLAANSGYLDMRFTNVDILSSSGTINLISEGLSGFSVGNYNIGNGLFLGQKSGSLVTSSSSPINISCNKFDLSLPLTINTSGAVVIEPFAPAFINALTWTSANFSLSSTATSFRIGKLYNNANITIPAAINLNGPMSIYGGAITLNGNLSSTNTSTGDVLIQGTTLGGTGLISVPNNKTLTLNLSAATTYSNAINGTGVNLIKEGAGALTLGAACAYSGNTTLNAGTLQFNENKTFAALTIANGTTLTLPSNKQFTINGTLTNNGTLTLENGATLVQGSSSSLAGSGTYNVKQEITGAGTSTPTGRFWYLGSPVATASSSVFFASNAANVVKKRDEATNTWTTVASGTPENLVVGKGYYTQAIPATSTITFTGGNINNGTVNITNLTRTSGVNSEGFNLVSNPYPSYLDWDAVTKTNVGNTMWYRTASGSTPASMVFDTYVAGSGGIGTNLNGNGVSNLIPPMQSFWVRVNQGQTSGSLALDNTMRAHFTSINGSVAGLKSTSNERDLFLRMNLLQADKKDQLIVYVNETATNGFDILDGEKMMQAGFPQFYTKAGDKKIVINGLNSAKKQQSLPITMELPTTGVHSFIIEDLEISNGLVWLEDKQEEIIQALEPGTVYEFYAASGLNAERFVLHFQLIDDAVPTNVYNEVNSSANFSGKGASVHAEAAGVVVIKLPASTEGVTDIQIRDAAGRLVYTGSTNTLETSVQLEQANGIYYVTLNATSGVEVRKVFIQQ
jgi:autotransporter-associated beta strand protein